VSQLEILTDFTLNENWINGKAFFGMIGKNF